MKKLFAIFGILVIVFLATSVVAEGVLVSSETQQVVKDVMNTKGINQSSIKAIKQIDLKNLPDKVKLENIDTNNLALYEVNVSGEETPVYVITASDNKIKSLISKFTKKMFLNFGFGGEFSESTYLKSAVGVLGSLDKGYVMMRDGSVTGISTNLEGVKGEGSVDILIYKNRELVGFKNSFDIRGSGIYNDYDTISENTLSFYPGDIISLYVQIEGNITIKDVNTLLEVETN